MSDTPRTDAIAQEWDGNVKNLWLELRELERENAALREDKERLDELLEHGVVGWYAEPRKWIGDSKITRCYTREDIDAARAKEAKEGQRCQCANGVIRSAGRDNDEVIEDCPNCSGSKEAKP